MTPTITDPTTAATEPTFEQLESMIESGRTHSEPAKEETPAPEVAKPKEAEPKEEAQTPEPGTGKEKPQEETEDELPENVKKRIAQEAKKQAFFQSKIDQAVSARKAKEAEAKTLTGESGSEPAKTTEPAKNERPKRPERSTFQGTEAEYNAALDAHEQALEKWLESRTEETVSRKFTERQAREAQMRQWDDAAAKHGAEFPALMATLAAATPPAMQEAISALDDWSTVAVHLAKNEDERAVLVELFKVSEKKAIAQLGKLEDRLKPEAKAPAKQEEKPLPKPLREIGGAAAGSAGRLDLDKASDGEALSEIGRMLKAS
jgi:hypothetical protein